MQECPFKVLKSFCLAKCQIIETLRHIVYRFKSIFEEKKKHDCFSSIKRYYCNNIPFKLLLYSSLLQDEPLGPVNGVSESPSSSELHAPGEGVDLLSPSGLAGVQLKFEDAPLLDQPPPTTTQVKTSRKKRSREAGKSDKEKGRDTS